MVGEWYLGIGAIPFECDTPTGQISIIPAVYMRVYASTATISEVAESKCSPLKFQSVEKKVIVWHNIWDNEVKKNCLLSA